MLLRTITALCILPLSFTSLAQEIKLEDETPSVMLGYYDIKNKQLIIKGPAAEAIWNQMANVETKTIMIGKEISGKGKESNGTLCEQRLERPRPFARSVLVTICSISQNKVGSEN